MPLIKPIRGSTLKRTHPLARGLVGGWLMNENGGNRVNDLSGNNNFGTFGAGAAQPSWSIGKFGPAVTVTGGGLRLVWPTSNITNEPHYNRGACQAECFTE